MKKHVRHLVLIALLVLSLGVTTAFRPPDAMDKSPLYTADQLVLSGAGYFYGIVVHTDETNACLVKIYDNTSAAGTARILGDWDVETSATNTEASFGGDTPIIVNTGIYVDITCAGTCTFQVLYRAK